MPRLATGLVPEPCRGLGAMVIGDDGVVMYGSVDMEAVANRARLRASGLTRRALGSYSGEKRGHRRRFREAVFRVLGRSEPGKNERAAHVRRCADSTIVSAHVRYRGSAS